MSNNADLFDSSSDADTDDLLAAAKSQPIAKKKGGDKKPAKKDIPGTCLICHEFNWSQCVRCAHLV